MSFFGIAVDGSQHSLVHRSELLERRTPAWIMGADKVPPIRGILSDSDIHAIKSAAGVRYTFVQGVGHQIALAAPSVIFSALRELFASMALRSSPATEEVVDLDSLAAILFDEIRFLLASKKLWSEYSTEEKAPWTNAARKILARVKLK
ncbi:MAG: hypothetical protein JSR98_00455 [Proteobacteria bacterium]|nr:hypothetical protein [Pseudomonadota bacterium]